METDGREYVEVRVFEGGVGGRHGGGGREEWRVVEWVGKEGLSGYTNKFFPA